MSKILPFFRAESNPAPPKAEPFKEELLKEKPRSTPSQKDSLGELIGLLENLNVDGVDADKKGVTHNTLARIHSMVDNLPLAVMAVDLEFTLIYMNQKSRDLFRAFDSSLSFSIDRMIGHPIHVLHKDLIELRSFMKSDKGLPYTTRMQFGDQILSLLVSALSDSKGNYIGPMFTWKNITKKLELVDSLEKTSSLLVESSGALTGTATEMARQADKTSRDTSTAATDAEKVSHGVQAVATSSEEMVAAVREISRSASETAFMTSETAKKAQQTNQTILQLGTSSNEIGKVIKMISSIAQQSNLLALNASIEAARAGEVGKGFAVVANEVKELAKQTAKATDEITAKIGAIQKDTSGAVEAIGIISSSMDKLNGISSSIAAAVEEQMATTNEVSRVVQESRSSVDGIAEAVKAVSIVAQNNSTSAKQTLSAAERITRIAQDVKELIKKVEI